MKQPIMLNDSNGGADWRARGVTRTQIYRRQSKNVLGSEKLFSVIDGILRENIEKGNIKDE